MLCIIVERMIKKDPDLALKLHEESQKKNPEIPQEVVNEILRKGYIKRGIITSNILGFFANKVVNNGGKLSVLP